MFLQIFAIVAPIFICAGIGYGWAKSGRKYDTNLITAIVSYFGTPCLVFHSISTVELSLSSLGSMAAAALTGQCLIHHFRLAYSCSGQTATARLSTSLEFSEHRQH